MIALCVSPLNVTRKISSLRQATKFQSCRGDICFVTGEKPSRKHFEKNNKASIQWAFYIKTLGKQLCSCHTPR